MPLASNDMPQNLLGPTNSRPTILKSEDVEQGDILWLAPYDETIASMQKRGEHHQIPVRKIASSELPNKGFFNHPILVLSRPTYEPGTIHFLLLRTFREKEITKRFKKGKALRERPKYMAMAPAPPHPLLALGDQMYKTLTWQSSNSMERPGYVYIWEVYSMEWQDAQPIWLERTTARRPPRLDSASLEALIYATTRKAGYTPGVQYNPSWSNNLVTIRTPVPTVDRTVDRFRPPLLISSDNSIFAVPRTHSSGIPKSNSSLFETSHSHPLDDPRPVDESEPLLPSHHRTRPFHGEASEAKSFFERLWQYMKSTRLGIILRFLFRCEW